VADRYAGIAGMTVGVESGAVVLDLSTPEQPEHTRLRLDRRTALDLAWQLADVADTLPEEPRHA
jgi:hypothetical protein